MRRLVTATMLAALSIWPAAAGARTGAINIVAAENFYGDIATQIAGPGAMVTSILSNPDEDPHLFEASPSVAKNLASADIVVYNGVDYDPWMAKLLAANKSTSRRVINVGEVMHRKSGVNPHLWYDPATAPAFAKALAAALTAEDPAGKEGYAQRLHGFLASLDPIAAKVASIRKAHAGTPVTATEPVIGYLAGALGFKMRNDRFQLAVMNNTEPSASDVAAFENDLKTKKVKLFFYNSQATDSAAQRLKQLAEANAIPVVGVTETEPANQNFQAWMLGELDGIDKALAGTP